MQGFKKTLVALLAVTMVLGLVGTAFAAPEDVVGTKYEDAVVRLMALGVFTGDDKGNFNPDTAINRAEATAVVIRALGWEKSADQMKGITKFADVNADPGLQWATGYINLAVSEGIIVGYPDGRFGGRDDVTYAQIAKMMLYAMKYGVTVEGGVWPNAVLAKAADLKLTKGLSVAANAPIPRGDVAKLVDNALDVPTMVQVSWGDTQMWQPTGDTLLQKLGYEEIEGLVFEVAAVNDSLKDNQIRVKIEKDEFGKYNLIESYKPGDYFGLDVKVWVNDDDEAVFIEPVTKAENVIYDRVDGNVGSGKIVTLLVKEKDYKEHADEATIYINGELKSFGDLKDGYFGKFVLKDNRVWFADVYKLASGDGSNGAIVKSIDGETVKYITSSDTEKKLRLGDADSYVLYKDGKEIALSDVKADDVLYWFKDGDDYIIFVAGTKLEGELEKVRRDSIVIDGEKYSLSSDKGTGITTVSSDDDDSVDLYADADTMLEDLGGEEVVVLLDLHGYVRHIRGDAESTSTVRGVALNWWKTGTGYIKVFTSKGEKVTYEFDKLTTYRKFTDSGSGNWDAGAEPAAGSVYAVKLTLNADGEVKEVKDLQISTTANDIGVKKIDKNGYLMINNTDKRIYVTDSTVFIDAATDKDDPEIVSWDSVKDSKNLDVKVLVLDGGGTADEAKLVVFTKNFTDIKPTSVKYAVVTDQWSHRGDTMITLHTVGGEEEDFEAVGKEVYHEKGAMVVYRVNAKGQADIRAGVAKADRAPFEVKKVDGRWIEPESGSKIRVASNAIVYDATDGLDEVDLGDISAGDKIAIMWEYDDDTPPKFLPDTQAMVIIITELAP